MQTGLLKFGALAILTGASVAGASSQRSSPVSDSFAKCRAIDAIADRAACYDRAYDALVVAQEKKEIMIVDRESIRETKKGLFGFAGPRLPFFSDNDEDTPKQVDSTIAGIKEIARDVYRIRLIDGAVWQTTDALTGIPKTGGEIHIRRTTMGGYALSLGRGRAVRAIRVQ